MSDGTSIEWADASWQPVLGCTRVSPGCDNCYAMKLVHRGLSESHRGLTKLRPKDASRPGVDWNGTVRLQPEKLAEPLRWRKPRRVFVCSLADLFHDAVPFDYIAAVFGVMAATPHHTYLVLTKRPERAREFFAWLDPEPAKMLPRLLRICAGQPWPLANVHLGTSVEDQQRADERVPALLQCPAAVHWVSAEPLLGPLYLAKPMRTAALPGSDGVEGTTWMNALYHLGWVVIGGESGPGARPFDIAWARSLIEQASGLGTRVFVKQLGAKPTWTDPRDAVLTDDRKGGTMEDWPTDLRVREVPT